MLEKRGHRDAIDDYDSLFGNWKLELFFTTASWLAKLLLIAWNQSNFQFTEDKSNKRADVVIFLCFGSSLAVRN